MCVVISSTNLSKTFLIPKQMKQDIIIMYVGLHIKYRYSS